MKLPQPFLVFLLFSGILLLSNTAVGSDQRRIDTEKLERQIDGVMLPLVEDSLLGGVVLVAVNDALVFLKAYGMANTEDSLPNEEDTKFEIASVTKLFTAVSILQLYEKGKLDLQDKLSKYISDLPSGEKITIYNLLTHTSGLPSYSHTGNQFAQFPDVIGQIKTLSLKFEPNENFEYSNSGYALLAYIIEIISGQTYEEYVRQNIFIPCGMDRSGMIPQDPTTTVSDLAKCYSLNESGGLQRSEPRGPNGKGDGALYCTAHDLYRFSKALFGHILLSQKNLDTMFQPFKQSHGLGCIVEDYKGWKVVHHPGGTQGVRTNFKTFLKPDSRVTVINLFNTDFMLSGLVDEQVERIALGEPWAPIFELDKSTAKSFRQFEGTYEIAADDTFRITIENNRMYYCGNDQKLLSAFPYGGRNVYVRGINSRFHFSRDEKSEDVSFVGFMGTPAGAIMFDGKRIRE